jgi:hypothetical protein
VGPIEARRGKKAVPVATCADRGLIEVGGIVWGRGLVPLQVLEARKDTYRDPILPASSTMQTLVSLTDTSRQLL